MDEFRSLRWLPSQPKHLDYINTQFLLIGESQGDLGKATEQQPRDEQNDKETPLEEMEKLEGEDEIRVKHLKGTCLYRDAQMLFADCCRGRRYLYRPWAKL